MSAVATPPDAETFVRRLLTTEDADERGALLARHGLDPGETRAAVRRLLDETERLVGADFRLMERISLDALTLAEQIGDEFLWAMARFKQGDALVGQSRNAEGRVCLDEAGAVFTRLGHPVEAARTRILWAWATANLGGDAEALASARAARRVLVAHGETLRVAMIDHNTGIIHFVRARYGAALRYFTRALSLYQTLGEPARTRAARAQQARGLALSRLGRYRDGLAELERVRDAHRQLGQDVDHAMAIRSIGETYMNLGRYAAALRTFQEALPHFRALGLHAGAVWLARDTADCYLYLNRPADALVAIAATEQDLLQIDRVTDVYALAARRVAAHLLLNDQEAALVALDELDRRFAVGDAHDQAWLAAQRATVLLRGGSAAEAVVHARRARTLARGTGMRRRVADAVLIEGAALLELGRLDDAGRAAVCARRLARALDAAPLLHRAYELLGQIAEAQDRPVVACRHYSTAIQQLEREQRGVIFEFRDSFAVGRGTAYEQLAALQLRAGRPAEALATAERAKSRALTDAIAGNVELRPRGSMEARRLARDLTLAREEYSATFARLPHQEDGDVGAAEREQGARRLAQLEVRIDGLVRRLQIAAAGDEIADLYGAAPAAALPTLPADTALIEFFFSGGDVLRFVVAAGGIRGDHLSGAVPEIERLLRVFRLNLDAAERAAPEGRDRLGNQARAVLARLYDRLLGNLDELDEYRSLVIVPHGLLHYLPFHALYDGQRYLIERHTISYAPSATLYGVCRARTERPSRRSKALVLAHTANGRLPYTLTEAATVGAVLGAPVHTEDEATRALLETDGRRAGVIHIAAHGRFRPDAPLFSHIELADGPLTTADIFNLDLRATLVTLSACETGRAVLGGGDELIGLTRAFLYAGTAGLLVSQWRVRDDSTALLMARFYEELRRGAGRAAALRAAQCAFLTEEMPQTQHAHPFFWAGFQIIGHG